MISSAGLFQTDLGTHDFQGQIVIQVEFRQNLSLSISGTLFFVVVFLSNSSLTILKSAFCFHPRKTVSFLQVFQLTFKHSVQLALRLDMIKWGNHALPFPSSKCIPTSGICLVLFTLWCLLIVHSFVLLCCSEFRAVFCQRVRSSENLLAFAWECFCDHQIEKQVEQCYRPQVLAMMEQRL